MFIKIIKSFLHSQKITWTSPKTRLVISYVAGEVYLIVFIEIFWSLMKLFFPTSIYSINLLSEFPSIEKDKMEPFSLQEPLWSRVVQIYVLFCLLNIILFSVDLFGRNVPGPTPNFRFGNTLQLNLDPHSTLSRWQKEYGLFYRLSLNPLNGHRPLWPFHGFVVAHPELLREILDENSPVSENLVHMDAFDWEYEQLLDFSASQKMQMIFPKLRNCLEHLEYHLGNFTSRRADFYPLDTFKKFSILSVARCTFSGEVNPFVNDGPLVKNLMQLTTFDKPLVPTGVFFYDFLLQPKVFGHRPEFVMDVLKKKIEMRQMDQLNPDLHQDLLQSFLDSTSDWKSMNDAKIFYKSQALFRSLVDEIAGHLKIISKKNFKDDLIVSNCYSFIQFATGKIAKLLTIITHSLATRDEIQEKLHSEVKLLLDSVGLLNYDALFRLKYLDAVVNETFRLYGPPYVTRRYNYDLHLSNGTTIKSRDIIYIPVDAIHRNEVNFPNAETFNPIRFLPQNQHRIASYTFLPFLDGPQNFLGTHFVISVVKLTVAQMVLRYKFKGSSGPERIDPSSFEETTVNMKIGIERRK